MERRKGEPAHFSPLPLDYSKMVSEIFTSNFDTGIKALRKFTKGDLNFEVNGAIYTNELVLAVSLVEKNQIAATTVYASTDYDPKASAPTIQELLSTCVDGIGALFEQLLSPDNEERLEQIACESLSALENIPYYWSEVKVDRHRIHLKVDKANPTLEKMADSWLSKSDPEFKKLQEENEKEAEKLFVTGPTRKLH
jgi:hypothetical protein